MTIKEVWKNPVFSISASVILLLVILGAAIPKSFEEAAVKLFSYTTVNFGWLYLLSVFIIILVLVFLAVGKYGSLRLGPDNELPEFPFSHGLPCFSPQDLALAWSFGEWPSQ
jgi:glycine betaine transporter